MTGEGTRPLPLAARCPTSLRSIFDSISPAGVHSGSRWAIAALACCVLLSLGPVAAHANPIQDENALPGSTGWKLVKPVRASRIVLDSCGTSYAGNPEIEGYASLTSVDQGGSIDFFVNTRESNYDIRVFRLGWYQGAGGREMMDPVVRSGVEQPIPQPDTTFGMVQGQCEWTDPYTLHVPDTWVSGIYVAVLTAHTSGRQGYIPFVVRNDRSHAALLYQSSYLTFQAYNYWGGKGLYPNRSTRCERAAKVSFDRPNNVDSGAGGIFHYEHNTVRWLEREGYDVTYCSDIDTHASATLLLNHRALLVVGHDEYWSWDKRRHVEAARDRGVSLGIFSANTCYWQVRLEPNLRTGQPNRTIVCYKDSIFDPLARNADPNDDRFVTGRWRDYPTLQPEQDLIGTMFDPKFIDTRTHNNDIVIANASSWVCAGTGLRDGDHLPGLLGSEADRVYGDGSQSPWIHVVGHSPFNVDSAGHDVTRGYSDMTEYQAASGAIVFATGSIRWGWGLDDFVGPDAQTPRVSAAAQQIMRNVLARFIEDKPEKWMSRSNSGLRMRMYPNPARRPLIDFEISKAEEVDLAVHDLQGRRVATLVRGRRDPGSYRVLWNGQADDGSQAPPGVYVCNLRAGGESLSMRSIKLE